VRYRVEYEVEGSVQEVAGPLEGKYVAGYRVPSSAKVTPLVEEGFYLSEDGKLFYVIPGGTSAKAFPLSVEQGFYPYFEQALIVEDSWFDKHKQITDKAEN